MSQFKGGSEVFPAASWDERMVGRMGEWLEWICDQAEEAGRYPSWKGLQDNFLTNFPDEPHAPSDKTFKRLITKTLRDSGRGKWIQ